MPAPSSTTAGTAGNILLVEEYGALAAAIGSALKKFAPGHQVRAVSALADAESAAVDLQPQLLIVDVDPPQSGIVDFFAKLKFTCPDARVLIIAAGLSRDLISARRATAAFEFIEKPFDLAELGRAVESQLAESSSPESTLRSVGLADLLPLLCSSRATAAITAEAAGGRWGEIHLAGGQIVHAVAGGRVGKQALHEILSWPAVRVTETEREETAPRTITAAWQTALLEAFAESKEVLDKPPRQKRQRAASKEPKKLVVVDDTELLLVFVEDILATALPELQIDLAGSGLDGLRQISATKPDAVLLDYSLPDITGNEVCRRLLEDERTAGIPVVMMSGHVPELTATALRYGNVVATIAKPFLSSALVELVRSTLAEAPKLKKPRTVADPVQSPSEAAPPSEPEAPALSVPERNGNRSNIGSPGDLLPPEADERSATREIVPSERQAPPPVTGIESEPEPLPKPADEPEPPEAAPTELTPAKSITELTRPEPALPVPLLTSAVGTSHSELRATVFPLGSTPQPFANFATASAVAPVLLPAAANNEVVLGVPLEVLAMQFSPTLQMAAIRARLWATTVTLHFQPNALPGMVLPEAGFELGRVDLDARGHIETVRLTPTSAAIARPPLRDALRVNDLAILPSSRGHAMEMTTTATSPMTMQLFALFELAGVELSQSFGVAALVLRSRGADIRVSLEPSGPSTGATFKTAQVLLDGEARIAEILLDAVA